MVATMLASFNFQKASESGEHGDKLADTPEFTNGGTWSVFPRCPLLRIRLHEASLAVGYRVKAKANCARSHPQHFKCHIQPRDPADQGAAI